MKIGLIKETKIPIDNRVALTPQQMARLQKSYPDDQFVVQSSPIRAYTDEEYRQLGIQVCAYIALIDSNISDGNRRVQSRFFSVLSQKLHDGSLEKVLYLLLFPVLLFSPFICISGFSFRFGASDFLLFLVTLAILKNGWWRKHLKALLLFAVIALYLFITIADNDLISITNNYFEIYAVFKLFLLYIWFSEMNPKMDLSPVFNICFIGLVYFNIIHYFNLFDFNTHIPLFIPITCNLNPK